MAQSLILAIDLGTSGAKAAVVAADGTILSTGHAGIETRLLPDGGAEQDPEEVWGAVRSACRQATDGINGDDILGVSTCSQFSSVVPVDADGKPTMNMVVWMDKRGAPKALRELPGGKELVGGLLEMLKFVCIHAVPPLDSGADSLAHMRWIKLARPEVYERTAAFLEPMDFLTSRMTGRPNTNPCSGFLMLLVDNRNLRCQPRYNPGLVRLSGIDPNKLPELLPVNTDVGTLRPEIADELGVPAGVRVFAGINDTQAGGAGCFALTGSHAGISVGTTSVLVTHVGFKKTDIRNSLVSMPSPVRGSYLVTAENGIGGRAIEYFLERLVFASDGFADHSLDAKFDALERAVADIEPGSGGVLFLPWLSGSFSPAEDGRVRGGFLNMSLDTTREHLGRAVLEGVAFNFRWLVRAVERFIKRRLDRLVFYGGGAVSNLWSQIFADVTKLPVHQVSNPRFTICRGVALLGFYWAGLVGLDDLESRVPIQRVYRPRVTLASLYDGMFEQFVQAFRKNRKIFRTLNS